MKPNRFTALAKTLKDRGEMEPPKDGAPVLVEVPKTPVEEGGVTPLPVKRGRGRPKGGKRTDPNYQQVTLYVRTRFYEAAQSELKVRRKKPGYRGPRDASDLVDGLLAEWLKAS